MLLHTESVFEGSVIQNADLRIPTLTYGVQWDNPITANSPRPEIFAEANDRDVDIFRIPNLTAGDTIRINVNGGTLNSVLRLFNANGGQLDISNPAGTNDSQITLTVPANGTYYFGVSGAGNVRYDAKPPEPHDSYLPPDSGDEGTYNFNVLRSPDDDTSPPAPNPGGSQANETDGQIQQFTWSFTDPSGIGSSYVQVNRNAQAIFTSAAPSGGVNFDAYGPGFYELYVSATDADNDWSGDASTLPLTRVRVVNVTDDDTSGPSVVVGGSSGFESHRRPNFFTWDISDPAVPSASVSSGIQYADVQIYHRVYNASGGLVHNDLIFRSENSWGAPGVARWASSYNFDAHVAANGLGVYEMYVRVIDSDNDFFPGDAIDFPLQLVRRVEVTNTPPTANPDPGYVGLEDGPLSGASVLGNDTDPDSAGPQEAREPLTARLVSGPAHAKSFTLNADGTFNYTPAVDYFGTDAFAYVAVDTLNAASPTAATASITILPVNDRPQFPPPPPRAHVVNEDAPAQVVPNWITGMTAGPANEAGQSLGFVLSGYNPDLFEQPPTIDAAGTLRYKPAKDVNGTTPVTAVLVDNGGTDNGGTDTSTPPYTFTIQINAVNDKPETADDSATADEDNAVVVNVLANDRPGPVTAVDEAGQALRVTAINGTPVTAGDSVRTLHGSARLNGDGTITYVPDADYNGDPAVPAYDDTFTYTATDDGVPPEGADGSGRVYINPVNDRPTALPPDENPVSLDEDTTKAIQLRGDDGDPEVVQALTYVIVRQPAWGVLKNFNPATGYVEYEPGADYYGPDSLAFKVRDDAVAGPPADLESGAAEVNLFVNPVNDAPVARDGDGPYAVDEDSGALVVTSPGVLGNDSDVDDALISAVLVSGPVHAKHFLLCADGSFVYEPAANFDQSDSFTYEAFDGKAYSNPITVNIHVNPGNDAPVIDPPIGDRQANEGEELVFTITARDADTGDRLTYSLVGAPDGATIDPDTGVFRWTPGEGQGPNGYQFTVRVTDNGSPQGADEEAVTVTVNEVNRRPTLGPIDAGQQVLEGQTLTFTATATDPDLPANELYFSLEGAPRGAAIDPRTGVFTWTPEEDQDGTHSFVVKVTDNGSPALSDRREVTVTVGEVNQDPRLSATSFAAVDERTDVSIALVGADDDTVAGVRNTLTYSIESGGLPGMVLDPATGAFAWTPSETQDGPRVVVFKVDDGRAGVARTTVQFLVREVNVRPTLAPVGDATVDELTTLTFTASSTDSDTIGGVPNALRYSLIGAPAGAAIDAETGEFTWTPAEADGPGSYTFKVRVTDNGNAALFDEDEVAVTVREVNVAPTLAGVPSSATIDEGVPYTFSAAAADLDLPGQALVFSLVGANVPAGAAIDPHTGVFTWTPAEGQAPGEYDFVVRVSDGVAYTDAPIRLITREVNSAPVLALIGRQYVDEGGVLRFRVSATDPDVPANGLRFSLGDDAPDGATIDPVTGEFSWAPPDSGVYTLTVRVTDDGTPALGDAQTVAVEVRNLAPTVADVFDNGPVTEGLPVTVTVAAADAGGGAADPLRYEFDFDNDGVYEVGPQAGNSAANVFADDALWAVGYRVTDDDGGVTTGVIGVETTKRRPATNDRRRAADGRGRGHDRTHHVRH